VADPGMREAKPRLVRGGAENAEPHEAQRSSPPGLVWVLAGLLAFAIGAAAVQSARLDRMTEHANRLTEHAESLRVELLDTHAQLRAYETQQEQVRESVADLADRVAALYEIVRQGAAPTPEPSPLDVPAAD
jgi:hypothetical protein